MRAVGLIVEYNPFHNGHLYHLQQSVKITESDAVVAVMSGNFLQRGEPALLNKWTRAEMALRGGCDLVIELPVAYATQAAEWFAYGAAALLDATGVVDALCFGSESGDIAPLRRIARTFAQEPAPFSGLLAEALAGGVSYPAAYSAAVRRHMAAEGDAEAAAFPLEQPNNTLGLHYLLALERLGSRIEPFSVKREKAGYSQADITDAGIASATAIRKLLAERQSPGEAAPFVPETTLQLLLRDFEAGHGPAGWQSFWKPLLHIIVSSSLETLSDYHEMSEGLENRLKRAIPTLPSLDMEALLTALKTKRYTRTKLQRALLAILLGHRKDQLSPRHLREGVQYIRVLGYSAKGRELLKRMRTAARLPVLLSAARPPEPYPFLELDVRATSLYCSAWPQATARDLFRDYYEKPVTI
ncbi:tRNA(Met) cytidine acetate ligase [Paenibacillus plantiphilus]|uniref:tRNA(Met) cytidine acetate ligase n=1 Tax=Paenibacillus plantiphilus TaxID=2905650 RepID=A0ABN8G5T7_9BACL|nr:nucleotidyltransferase [Paenibacillus plantiphilus]CAH1197895.1 tRNA(Met) cytidine acetate ligase [Paenibacillus plantiphilus]